MDPKMLKVLGITYQSPMDDGTGGGDADVDDVETGDEDEEETEDVDDDEETEEETEDDDGEGTDDDEDDGKEEGDEDLGERAQKRIGKLVKERNSAQAENKRLKEQLDEAQKLSGDDGKAIYAAAKRTGILPGLMTKDEAKAFTALEQYPQVIETYQDWLDEHDREDEFGSGDEAMSYGQVKKRIRQLKSEYEGLKDEYGDRRKELTAKVRKIFELGMEAYRKGGKAKPGEEGKPKKKGTQKPSVPPRGKKPVAKGGKKKVNWGEVSGTDSFARMIAAQNGD